LTELHEDAENLRGQLDTLRQRVTELEQEVSERTREIRDRELRAVANERDKDNLFSQLAERSQ